MYVEGDFLTDKRKKEIKDLTGLVEVKKVVTRRGKTYIQTYWERVDKNTRATGAIPRDDIERMDKHAELYYEEIRKTNSDIAKIAKNAGFSISDITKIKNHIFFNKYDLGGLEKERFYPNYDMAVSWQRLIDGKNIQEMDMVLLKHEMIESELMEKAVDYNTAHIKASKQYNYKKYLDDLDKKFKKKGDKFE